MPASSSSGRIGRKLIECGALVRIGRNLTILGEGYAQFLARKAKRVPGYVIAPNRTPGAGTA